MPKKEKLMLVDENGIIIGEDTRENIHSNGLLHREVHVWFYTTKGEIILQHRSKNTDTRPDTLDASVGGHVENGDDFVISAIKEAKEETGIQINQEDLKFIDFTRTCSFDPATKKTNNAYRAVFAYLFKGNVTDLKVENGKGDGFELWPIDKVINASETDKPKFNPGIVRDPTTSALKKIQSLMMV